MRIRSGLVQQVQLPVDARVSVTLRASEERLKAPLAY